MPYTEVKVRVQCKCAALSVHPSPRCKICHGTGWIEKWESLHVLLMDCDVQFKQDDD